MNSVEAPTAKTHNLISIISKIRQASPKADFERKLDAALIRSARNVKTEEYFLGGGAVFFMAANRKNKIDMKWIGPGIIIGRFGNKYELVHARWSYFEVDLEDMCSTSSLFDIVGFDGTLTLHVPRAKFPIRYLAGSQTLVFLTKMRHEYSLP